MVLIIARSLEGQPCVCPFLSSASPSYNTRMAYERYSGGRVMRSLWSFSILVRENAFLAEIKGFGVQLTWTQVGLGQALVPCFAHSVMRT